ncbi:MAG: DEAD/DEAH box helicase [Solirubrobacterales bacterium]
MEAARSDAVDLPWGESVVDTAWGSAIDPGREDGRLVAESLERAVEANEVPLPAQLDPGLTAALKDAGVRTLYAHQLAALRAVETSDVVVTSGTASGKSLAFNMPVLDAIARDPVGARALYLYPTKALAQDQARKLFEIAPEGLRHAIYDGDTPREERPAIRRRSNLILTNPDMVHVSLLPHHKRWAEFVSKLRFVVVDEAHVYRGVFGSHVANVLRRLRRVAVCTARTRDSS